MIEFSIGYGDDTQRARSMAIINALLGNYKMPGGMMGPQKSYGVPKIKFPHSSVVVPSEVPFTTILAPDKGELLL